MNNKILLLLFLTTISSLLQAMHSSQEYISQVIVNDIDARKESQTGRLVYPDLGKLYPEKKSVPQNSDQGDIIEHRKKWQKPTFLSKEYLLNDRLASVVAQQLLQPLRLPTTSQFNKNHKHYYKNRYRRTIQQPRILRNYYDNFHHDKKSIKQIFNNISCNINKITN